jgi:hypothetical protein
MTSRQFRFSTPHLPAIVMKGDSLRIRISFGPDSLRFYQDTLVIVSNGINRVLKIPIAGSGSLVPGGNAEGTLGEFALFPNFPNPFNASTTFRFVLPVPSRVRLELFTTIGQSISVVVDGAKDAGYHNVMWNTDVTSGMYICRFSATPLAEPGKTFVGTRKVVVIR